MRYRRRSALRWWQRGGGRDAGRRREARGRAGGRRGPPPPGGRGPTVESKGGRRHAGIRKGLSGSAAARVRFAAKGGVTMKSLKSIVVFSALALACGAVSAQVKLAYVGEMSGQPAVSGGTFPA